MADMTVAEATRRLKACGWMLCSHRYFYGHSRVIAERKVDWLMAGVRLNGNGDWGGYTNQELWAALADLVERVEALEGK